MRKKAKHSQSSLAAIASKLKALWQMAQHLRSAYNRRMARYNSPSMVAAAATALCFAAAVILLFLPRYIGVADDGSLQQIMRQAGLQYSAADAAQPEGAYFVRVYERTVPAVYGGFSTHICMIRFALSLDHFFTQDNFFDVRFLAFLYLCLYLPAVWLFTKQAACRVKFASERTVLGAAAVLLFGDVSYLAYFNSLYPEALWFICLLYCCGFCLSLQISSRWDNVRLLLLAAFGIILTLTEQHCAVFGFALSLFCLRQIAMDGAKLPTKTVAALSALVLILAGFSGLISGNSRFSMDSKLNAMTSGVLLESSNPEQTLAEFGIDARFETLADTSSYSGYPLTKADNPELQTGFYDRYSSSALMLYYARHPAALAALLEQGVHAAFNVRRDYCGNYEVSASMPPKGRTPLFALASNFKVRFAPKTLGYLLLLAIVYGMMQSKRNTRNMHNRARRIMLDTFWTFLTAGLAHMFYIILRSGTAELSRYSLIFSVCIDFISFLTFTGILHRLNLLETEEGQT
ncbi:MAG: hypothetical protein ACFWUC_05960 [Oscillospiraceae bacterium]